MLFSTLLLVALLPRASTTDITDIHIGAILANHTHLVVFKDILANMTAPSGYRYVGVPTIIGSNPVATANTICSDLLPKKVVTVLFDVSPDNDEFMSSVPFTLEFYKIPVVGVSSRSSVLSNAYAHPQFMRTVPPYSFEAGLWFNTLNNFSYNKVIFIYTNDVEGQITLNQFRQHMLKYIPAYGEKSIEITKLVMLQPYKSNFTEDLQPILTEDSRVILLATGPEIATYVYRDARKLRLLAASWVWIVSEQAAKAVNVPQGTLNWQVTKQVTDIELNMRDALSVINYGISNFLNRTDLGTIPDDCGREVLQKPDDAQAWWLKTKDWWQEGVDLFEIYKKMSIIGESGIITFTNEGDREFADYHLINVLEDGSQQIVGNFTKVLVSTGLHDNIEIAVNQIKWPGNLDVKPAGVNVSKHLRVVTIEETPFVYTEPLDESGGCNVTQLNDPDAQAKMRCPRHITNGTVLEFCCYGYLIDMLDMLRINMSVTFDLHLVSDGHYGTQEQLPNKSGKSEWNGMMGELLEGKADMILAPFVINPERAKYVDFTKPFKFLGITILVKKSPKISNLDSFLQPFQSTLWFLVVVSVHVIALVLYLLDRFSPFGQLQLARESDSEDSLSLSTAIWFAWGVLLNSGIGEGTPKSFSARVLGMVWAGFAMIIVASYTANLAAFLVLDKPKASISGIDDPRLRNPTDDFKFGTVKASAIENYFKRQVEFTTMYRTMDKYNKESVEKAIAAVESGELDAFIWDSPRLIYEATKKCDLVTARELFGRSSYGIAFKKNSHWTDNFSLHILSYHEVGKMEKYDNKWIMNTSMNDCDATASSPATLGLTNMAGVFIMVAAGIGIGFIILLIEIGYSKYESMKEKQNTIAKKAVARWKRYVQRRKALRKTWTLIKNINETDNLTDEQRRKRIRDYLEDPHHGEIHGENGTAVVTNGRHRAANVSSTSFPGTSSNALLEEKPEQPNMANGRREESPTSAANGGYLEEFPGCLCADGAVKQNPLFIDNV